MYDIARSLTEWPVIIEHRDAGVEAVLISHEELRRLERRAAAAGRAGSPFKLIGSATLHGDPLTVLDDARRAEGEAEQARQEELGESLRSS